MMRRDESIFRCITRPIAQSIAAAGLLLTGVVITIPGCGGGFLGLEDYQRDVLSGLAAALLLQPAPAPAGQPVPGADGVNCWDINGNGQNDPNEDTNGDGEFDARDCQGSDATAGSPGRDGDAGTTGLRCWDLNGNGVGDANEDRNGDGRFDTTDCQGSDGSDGSSGSNGSSGTNGADGPAFFSIFIDDFFGTSASFSAQLPVELIRIDEPVLNFAQESAIGYRVAIPQSYQGANDVTMRLMFYRTGFLDGDCFIFSVDARQLRSGSGVEVYDRDVPDAETCNTDPSVAGCGRRWVRIEQPDDNGTAAGEIETIGVFVVIDLPLNSTAGLDYPALSAGDLLAFELTTHEADSRTYELLGVEFFESGAGNAALSSATVILSVDEVCCVALTPGPGLSVPDDHVFISDGETLRVSNIADLTAVADIAGSLSTSGGYDDGHHMVFDTAGQRIFVTEHDDPLLVFDTTLTELFPDTDVWVDNLILDEPLGIAPLPDGKLLITDEDAGDGLFRINADLTLDSQIRVSVFDGGEGVAYDSIHDRILVADEDDGDIEIFDGPSLEHLGGTRLSCGSEGPYWIGVDGSTDRVFMLAEGRCFNNALETTVYGIHVFDLTVECDVNEVTFNRTLFGSRGQNIDCYGTLAVSESTDRLFAIDYCTDDAHPLPTVDIFDTGTLEFLGSVPMERTGQNPLMLTVGHLAASGSEGN